MEEQVLLLPETVAKKLGTTEGTLAVWRSRRRYNLPYVKIGALVRYRSEDVDLWIETRTVGQPAPEKPRRGRPVKK